MGELPIVERLTEQQKIAEHPDGSWTGVSANRDGEAAALLITELVAALEWVKAYAEDKFVSERVDAVLARARSKGGEE
jgi:hypothetical protein